MKNIVFAAFTLFALALNFAAPSLADTKRGTAPLGRSAELISLLPASDAVATVDAKRFIGEALPGLLSANPTLLGKITSSIDELQSKTGVDMRQFDTVVAGFAIKKISAKNFDFDPVVVARGQINSGALIAEAKLAANGKYREEKAGTRTIYIFAPKEIAKQKAAGDAKKLEMIDKAGGPLAREMALTAYDANTIVGGSLVRVRELLAAKTKVSTELAGYLGRTDGALIDFAAKAPNGMSGMLPLDNDELGKNIDSIRVLYGNMSVSGETTTLNATAKTLQPEQAKSLKETLDGLQMIGKAFLGSSKSADKQVYARMIDNARFTQTGNEVSLVLSVPQSDINVLVASIK
ncbi:MAG: hypothetical protein ABI791_14740 [Acidobacteriota bacterium]